MTKKIMETQDEKAERIAADERIAAEQDPCFARSMICCERVSELVREEKQRAAGQRIAANERLEQTDGVVVTAAEHEQMRTELFVPNKPLNERSTLRWINPEVRDARTIDAEEVWLRVVTSVLSTGLSVMEKWEGVRGDVLVQTAAEIADSAVATWRQRYPKG